MFGFLNVYKPKGMTSHDVVSVLRRITKIKQIGHTGTLDPFAEGVLPVCIGKATRLIEYLNDDKAYIGTVQLGISTTTYDIEGEAVNKSNKKVSQDDIEASLKYFIGEIEQVPPIYSAIKVNGKKLYEYARAGENIEIKSRKVNISELKILNFDYNKQQLELYISCSKGTYIRSVANDLGEKLGVYGHLNKLVRVKAGYFNIENAVQLDNLNNLEDVKNNLLSPIEYLDYPRYKLSNEELKKVSNGMPFSSDAKLNNGIIILTQEDNIAGIGEVNNKKIKILKVFV